MARTDVLLDESFELIDEGTEWAEGESDQQHVELLVLLGKGEIKEFPWACFGINTWINKRFLNRDKFERDLDVELENDGYPNAQIDLGNSLSDFKITI